MLPDDLLDLHLLYNWRNHSIAAGACRRCLAWVLCHKGSARLQPEGVCLQEGAKSAKELPECVLEVPSLHEVELNYGSQDLPDFSRPGSAAGEPIMKERALLQVGMAAPDLPLISPPSGCSSCQEKAKAVQ